MNTVITVVKSLPNEQLKNLENFTQYRTKVHLYIHLWKNFSAKVES